MCSYVLLYVAMCGKVWLSAGQGAPGGLTPTELWGPPFVYTPALWGPSTLWGPFWGPHN